MAAARPIYPETPSPSSCFRIPSWVRSLTASGPASASRTWIAWDISRAPNGRWGSAFAIFHKQIAWLPPSGRRGCESTGQWISASRVGYPAASRPTAASWWTAREECAKSWPARTESIPRASCCCYRAEFNDRHPCRFPARRRRLRLRRFGRARGGREGGFRPPVQLDSGTLAELKALLSGLPHPLPADWHREFLVADQDLGAE